MTIDPHELDPNELVRLGTVMDALHLSDRRESDEHPADAVLRTVAGRFEFGGATGARYVGTSRQQG